MCCKLACNSKNNKDIALLIPQYVRSWQKQFGAKILKIDEIGLKKCTYTYLATGEISPSQQLTNMKPTWQLVAWF